MTKTDTAIGVQDEAVDLWVTSYQGEVFGEAYFTHMAAHSEDPATRSKLEGLAALERCTKELLAPSLARLGIRTEPNRDMLDAIAASMDFDYRKMLEAIPPLAAVYLGYYHRLRQLVGPEDAGVADLLIAHEMALELFARREIAGDTDDPLLPVRALSHVTL